MKRLIKSAMAVFAVSSMVGCCCPGPFMPWGGGCGMQQGGFPGTAPTGYNMGYDGMQTASPVWTSPVAMPMTTYPTVAVESLPTYR